MAVPPELLIYARQLRKGQTQTENLLWNVFRQRRFCGFKFRRQYPVCGYILDFYCYEARLGIEIDGGGHAEEEQLAYDVDRTKMLEAAGIHIVRFWNHDVLQYVEDVLEQVYEQLTGRV